MTLRAVLDDEQYLGKDAGVSAAVVLLKKVTTRRPVSSLREWGAVALRSSNQLETTVKSGFWSMKKFPGTGYSSCGTRCRSRRVSSGQPP